MNYLVVDFVEENGVDIVSECWMVGTNLCHWPPLRSSAKIARAVQSHQSPDNTWPTFTVRILYKADNYEKARQKLSTAEDNSDIQTNDEAELQSPPKRKKIVNRRYTSDYSDEDEDEVPLRKSPRKLSTTASSPRRKTTLPQPPSTPVFHPLPQSSSSMQQRQSSTPRPSSTPRSTSTRPSSTQSTPRLSVSASRTSEAVSPVERQIFVILEGMKAKQEELLAQVKVTEKKIDSLMARLPESETRTDLDSIDTELGLPINTSEDLVVLDQELCQDETPAKQLVLYLSRIGGRKVDDCVRRVMAVCMTDHLAQNYNWLGRCGKIAFSKLHLVTLIFQAVQKTSKFKKATRSEVEEVMKNWLRYAADRNGGRSKRREDENV